MVMTRGEFRKAVCEEMLRRGYDQYWADDLESQALLQGRPVDPHARMTKLWCLRVTAVGKNRARVEGPIIGHQMQPVEEITVVRDITGVLAACDLAVRHLMS